MNRLTHYLRYVSAPIASCPIAVNHLVSALDATAAGQHSVFWKGLSRGQKQRFSKDNARFEILALYCYALTVALLMSRQPQEAGDEVRTTCLGLIAGRCRDLDTPERLTELVQMRTKAYWAYASSSRTQPGSMVSKLLQGEGTLSPVFEVLVLRGKGDLAPLEYPADVITIGSAFEDWPIWARIQLNYFHFLGPFESAVAAVLTGCADIRQLPGDQFMPLYTGGLNRFRKEDSGVPDHGT